MSSLVDILTSLHYIYPMKRFFLPPRFTSYLGLLLTAVGVPVLIIDKSPSAEIPLLVGLFILFISRETRNDERSVAIKTSSAYIALVLGYAIKLVTTNLYSHQLIPVQLTEINHFLILVFALAIAIYYSRMYVTFNKSES